VAAGAHIADEGLENYADRIGGDPPAGKGSGKIALTHGNLRKDTVFSTDRHSSSYSRSSKIKAKTQWGKSPWAHNRDVRIMAGISSFFLQFLLSGHAWIRSNVALWCPQF
jgi:hypothetical protein